MDLYENQISNALMISAPSSLTWTDLKLLRSAVRKLNAQHRNTSAGFYGLGSRFFRARSVAGVLEVFDFDTWTPVSQEQAKFHSHNGEDISFE